MNYKLESVTVFSAVTSFVCSSSIVVTTSLFPKLRCQPFMKIFRWMAFSWSMQNLGVMFGFPSNSSSLCQFQGWFILFFSYAAGTWLFIMYYKLHEITMADTIVWNFPIMHAFCWTVSGFFSLIPLVKFSYGRPTGFFPFSTGLGVCSVYYTGEVNNTDYNEVYAGPMGAAAFVLVIFIVFVTVRLYIKYKGIGAPIRALIALPAITLLTWVPWALILVLCWNSWIDHTPQNALVLQWSYCWLLQNGTGFTVSFYASSTEARKAWHTVFMNRGITYNDIVGSPSSSFDSSDCSRLSVQLMDTNIDRKSSVFGIGTADT